MSNPRAGYTARIWDSQAKVLAITHSSCNTKPIHLIELRRALLGLQKAADFSTWKKKIWLEIDSALSVDWINRKSGPPWQAFYIISHIWQLLSSWEEVKVTHIWREANRAADYLAGIDANFDLFCCSIIFPEFSLIPSNLSSILKEKEGKVYSRALL